MSGNGKALSVLWNVKSGWSAAGEQATRVREVLAGMDPDPHFCRVEHGRDLASLARQRVEDGSTVVIAAGGDGTINAVASALVHRQATLGIIPAGTLNHFARDLGFSLDPVEAAQQLLNSQELSVDVGQVNGRVFINNSVLGLYPIYWVVRRAFESHGWGGSALGRFAAVLGGILRVFWRLPHLHLRLVTETEVREVETPFILVANNEHELEKGRIGKRKALNEGHLWVYVMRRSSRWAVLRYFLRYIAGRFSRYDAFEEFKVKELCIRTGRRKRIGVGVDGEVVPMHSPLEYRSLPGALRVLVPSDSPIR